MKKPIKKTMLFVVFLLFPTTPLGILWLLVWIFPQLVGESHAQSALFGSLICFICSSIYIYCMLAEGHLRSD